MDGDELNIDVKRKMFFLKILPGEPVSCKKDSIKRDPEVSPKKAFAENFEMQVWAREDDR